MRQLIVQCDITQRASFETPSNERLISIFRNIKQRLLRHLDPSEKTYKQADDQLDEKIFIQMLENDVFSLESVHALTNTFFLWLSRIQAPARDESTEQSRRRVLSASPKDVVNVLIKELNKSVATFESDMFIFIS